MGFVAAAKGMGTGSDGGSPMTEQIRRRRAALVGLCLWFYEEGGDIEGGLGTCSQVGQWVQPFLVGISKD